tara:strand:+ start:583 stop:891 length:309 start_codon:yes stop_codon:yes gene_type:complete
MKIKSINQMPVGLAILWDDGTDSLIPCKVLRNACPCAYCSGETDVFGNIYIGEGIRKTDLAYEIQKIESVGHYAVRIYWKDNHNSGIYPFELLRKLNEKSEN